MINVRFDTMRRFFFVAGIATTVSFLCESLAEADIQWRLVDCATGIPINEGVSEHVLHHHFRHHAFKRHIRPTSKHKYRSHLHRPHRSKHCVIHLQKEGTCWAPFDDSEMGGGGGWSGGFGGGYFDGSSAGSDISGGGFGGFGGGASGFQYLLTKKHHSTLPPETLLPANSLLPTVSVTPSIPVIPLIPDWPQPPVTPLSGVPETSTWIMMLMGLGSLAVWRKFKKTS